MSDYLQYQRKSSGIPGASHDHLKNVVVSYSVPIVLSYGHPCVAIISIWRPVSNEVLFHTQFLVISLAYSPNAREKNYTLQRTRDSSKSDPIRKFILCERWQRNWTAVAKVRHAIRPPKHVILYSWLSSIQLHLTSWLKGTYFHRDLIIVLTCESYENEIVGFLNLPRYGNILPISPLKGSEHGKSTVKSGSLNPIYARQKQSRVGSAITSMVWRPSDRFMGHSVQKGFEGHFQARELRNPTSRHLSIPGVIR